MKYICLSLFPEMIEQGLKTSVIGKAIEQGIIELKTYDIRNYTTDKHGSVDDYTYGGGAGMLMQAQPVFDAYHAAVAGDAKGDDAAFCRNAFMSLQESGDGVWKKQGDRVGKEDEKWKENGQPRTIYVTPQGRPFTQKIAEELAKEEKLVFLCGHYEGIDERVLDEIVTDQISIGDYVLTGGELAVMVMIDAISRLVPGVLGNETSADTESFHNDLLEYPQYTRPEVWHGKQVPEVLLSGNKKEIEKWRLERSVERTREARPDLYEKYQEKQRLIERLLKDKRGHIHMIEGLRRGTFDILQDDAGNVVLYNWRNKIYMVEIAENSRNFDFFEKNPANASKIIIKNMENAGNLSKSQLFFYDKSQGTSDDLDSAVTDESQENGSRLNKLSDEIREVYCACYTENVPLKVILKDIRPTNVQDQFALYIDGRIIGTIEGLPDGSIGMPKLCDPKALKTDTETIKETEAKTETETEMNTKSATDPVYEIKSSLLAFLINRHRSLGFLPFAFVETKDTDLLELVKKMGMYLSKDTLKIWTI